MRLATHSQLLRLLRVAKAFPLALVITDILSNNNSIPIAINMDSLQLQLQLMVCLLSISRVLEPCLLARRDRMPEAVAMAELLQARIKAHSHLAQDQAHQPTHGMEGLECLQCLLTSIRVTFLLAVVAT
jgi:hypothetical protein